MATRAWAGWQPCLQQQQQHRWEASGGAPCCSSLLKNSVWIEQTQSRGQPSAAKRLTASGERLRRGMLTAPGCTQRRRGLECRAKMHVPGYGDKSPEGKAADSLHNFFTYLAVKIVMAQLQAYNPESYNDLKTFTDRVSLKDGNAFVAQLMRESPQHKGLAMRILEVRSAYGREDFEWDNLQKLSSKLMDESNTRLMREFLVETSKFGDRVE